MTDTALLSSAALLGVATAASTVVSLRHPHLVDEPFGLRFPGRLPVHLALGLGSGVAVPWPLSVWRRSRPCATSPAWPGRGVRVRPSAPRSCWARLSSASWGLRPPRSRAAVAIVPLLLLTGSALFVAGTRHARSAP